MAGARVGAKYARQRVPVLTGALKRSIKATRNPAKQRGKVEALVNARSPIAHLIEYGTVKMSPQPYLRPAIDEHRPEIVAKMTANLERWPRPRDSETNCA